MGGRGLGIPEPLLEKIRRIYSTDTEKTHACADYYVNCHPQAEWEHLTRTLYVRSGFAALREKKSWISTGKDNDHRLYTVGPSTSGRFSEVSWVIEVWWVWLTAITNDVM